MVCGMITVSYYNLGEKQTFLFMRCVNFKHDNGTQVKLPPLVHKHIFFHLYPITARNETLSNTTNYYTKITTPKYLKPY